MIVGSRRSTTPAMNEAEARRWQRRCRYAGLLAAGLALGTVLASCEIKESDQFNDRASELVCEIYDKCGEDITGWLDLGFGTSLDSGCHMQVFDDFDACSANCDFNAGRARRCIRRLEKIADDCEQHSLGPCRRVYQPCAEGFNDATCELWACSVSDRPSPAGGLMALGLLVLGWRRRRR